MLDVKRYRAILKAKAVELKRRLNKRNAIAVERAADNHDRMVLATQRELAMIDLDGNSKMLREINAALVRIDEGNYGICECCDEPIKPRRLDALPWARLCVPCQETTDDDPTQAACLPRLARMAA